MAYSLLAGMPPIYGLYASIVPIVLYALMASSTKMTVGPVAVSALLVLAGVSQIAVPGTPQYIGFVITAGLLIGTCQITLGLFKLGFLVNFLSHPVIAGFTSAAAIIIVASQLKDMLGLDMTNSHHTVETIKRVISNLGSLNVVTTIIALSSFVLIFIFKKISRKIPGPLIMVVLGTVICALMKLDNQGVAIVGTIPSGLSSITLPSLDLLTLSLLWPTVLTVTLIGIVESIGIAKALESKHKDHNVKPNQELLALGFAKVGGSFFEAIPTSGSFSRSAINSDSNAKTQVSSLITVSVIVLVLLFLTSWLYYLPKAILAAIIMFAVLGLFDIKEAKHLWKTDRLDFWMMASTFFLTLALGIEAGVLSGVILSLLAVIYNTSAPRMSELGQVEGTQHYKNIERYTDAKLWEDSIIVRFENEIFFGNASFFKDKLTKLISAHKGEVKYVVLDASLINNIDSTGTHMLKDLDDELNTIGVQLHICNAIGYLRDSLYKAGLLNEVDRHHTSVHEAITYIHNDQTRSDILCRSTNPLQTNEK